MVMGRRITALFIMTIISTATPAVYQVGIEPRVAGAKCEIYITSLRLDQEYTEEGVAVFKAYLRIENRQPVDVILSQLTLDVYHYSSLGRYQLIGSMNTSQEYKVGPNEVIQSVYENGRINTIYPEEKDGVPVVAKLAFFQDSVGGSATTEAIGNLISRGYLSLYLKGKASVGPFSFDYEIYPTLYLNFWDPNFVIIDVLPYLPYESSSVWPQYTGEGSYSDSGVGKYIIHAKMHNPSGIPFVINDYTFSLVDSDNNLRAVGFNISEIVANAYDPDVTQEGSSGLRRVRLATLFKKDQVSTTFSSDKDEWQDIFFGFDFSDPDNPNPESVDSKTKDNILWFINKLFTNPILSGINLKGTLNMHLGWYDGSRAKGISVNVGSLQSGNEFIIYNSQFYQQHYSDYDGQEPVSLQEMITPGKINVDAIEIDSGNHIIKFNMSSDLTFSNPYRFSMTFSDFNTNYYRVDKNNVLDYDEQYSFGSTEVPDVRTIVINPAHRAITNPVNTNTNTVIDHNFTMEYDTSTYEGNSAISKILTDMDIDDTIVNWTNPFWLMSPQPGAMDVDPLIIARYLIQKGLDPLMQLNSTEVTYSVKSGGDAYNPIKAFSFGERNWDGVSNYGGSYWDMKSMNIKRGESGDLHQIDNDPARTLYSRPGYAFNNRIMKPYTVGSNWLDPTNAFLAPYIQYAFASKDPSPGKISSTWTWDSQREPTGANLDKVNGILGVINTLPSTSPPTIPSSSEFSIYWRFYNRNGTDASDYLFGYWYDWEGLLRNYYIVYDPSAVTSGHQSGNSGFAACQNFTLLDTNDPTAPQGITSADIVKATMSISYRYPNGGTTTGRFGLGKYTQLGGKYYYDYSILSGKTGYDGSSSMFVSNSGLNGITLDNPTNSKQWLYKVIDVTQIIKDAISSGNPNDTRFEIAFGTTGTGSCVYFDDVQINIEYRDPNPSLFNIADLFKQTESVDSVNGNMWNILSSIDFKSANFAAFLGNDKLNNYQMGLGTQQPDLVSYFQGSGVNISMMTKIMDQEPEVFDAAEPISFLEMLNTTRYVIDGSGDKYIKGLGYRDELGNVWAVEDPYRASKYISDTLARYIHTNDATGVQWPADTVGEELWLMLDNLQVWFPWVIMYLMSKGWSKDDVFDVLEALGFASEVKTNYNSQDSNGRLTTTLSIVVSIELFGAADGAQSAPTARNFEFPMGKTVTNGYQQLFRYLFDGGETHQYGSPAYPYSVPYSRTLVSTASILPGVAVPDVDITISINKLFGFTLPFSFNIQSRVSITPLDFSLAMWMQNLNTADVLGAVPTYVDYTKNPYLSGEKLGGQLVNIKGFKDEGARVLASLVRQNYLFNGEPFISTGGDPIGLFQFLDQYYFDMIDSDSNGINDFDFSSYTLLDYFNVKSTDFIDIITGYNRLADEFDGGNTPFANDGKANDWLAPLSYGGNYSYGPGVTNKSAAWNGWGVDFWDGRIFWHPLDNNNYYNGHIIWSDSPTLLDLEGSAARTSAHRKGEVYYQTMGSGTDNDRPWEGAPPCVNLIDMLLWISKTTGIIDSDKVFKWIIGELPQSYYKQVKSLQGSMGDEFWPYPYNCGIGNYRTWGMLQNSTFNVTGMFNFLETTKKADPWKLLYALEERSSTGAPDPQNLMYWALNPNMVLTPEGHTIFMYHDSLGATRQESKQFVWQLFNASYWEQHGESQLWNFLNKPEETLPYLLFEHLRDLELNGTTDPNDPYRVKDFNLFNILMDLYVDPIDWWDDIQYSALAITPLNVLYSSDKLNLTAQIRNAGYLGKSSMMKINGTFNIGVFGLNLTGPYSYHPNTQVYSITPTLFTAAYHWSEFIDPNSLYRATFVMY